VNDMREVALGKIAMPNIGGVECNCGVPRQVRRRLRKLFGMSRQSYRVSIKMEATICPNEALEQPASKKPCGARNQDALTAQVPPERLRARQNVLEIAR